MTWVRVGKSRSLRVSSRSTSNVRPDGGEHLGLLDGVDAEVGFEVEVEVEQFGRVAGQVGDDRHDGVA